VQRVSENGAAFWGISLESAPSALWVRRQGMPWKRTATSTSRIYMISYLMSRIFYDSLKIIPLA
jgi:hypothetical protein